jgi:hypothetical protein
LHNVQTDVGWKGDATRIDTIAFICCHQRDESQCQGTLREKRHDAALKLKEEE